MNQVVGNTESRKGFTVIEVMLFLAITGLMMAGLLSGLGGSLSRQRYNDAVQDIAADFREIYSMAVDTQIGQRGKTDGVCRMLVYEDIAGASVQVDNRNAGRGRSDCVVYGVMVSIHDNIIETMPVIGKDISTVDAATIASTGNELNLFSTLKLTNIVGNGDATTCTIGNTGYVDRFTTKWGTSLKDNQGNDLKGTLLIVRSPRTGAMRTYVWKDVVRDNDSVNTPINFKEFTSSDEPCTSTSFSKSITSKLSASGYFQEEPFRICVESGDQAAYNGKRRMIKINKSARGVSDIELINLDVAEDDDEAEDVCN